jgi:hypothetical protein
MDNRAEELQLEQVELQMLEEVLREYPLLVEWLLKEWRAQERQLVEHLIKEDSDVVRGQVKAYRACRDRIMTLKREVLGERNDV